MAKLRLSKNPFKTLFFFWFAATNVFMLLVSYPFLLYTLKHPKTYPIAHKIRRIWVSCVLFLCCIKVKQTNECVLDKSKPYIIVPNHQSRLDIFTLIKNLDLDFSFMAMAEFKKIPLYGIWFRTIDIAVDRTNTQKAANAYRKAFNFLNTGRSLVIFPEATINKTSPQLSDFKDGPFRLAIEKQVDILPVTFLNNYLLMPDKGKYEFKPGCASQIIHKPISTLNLTLNDVSALKEKVYCIIETKLIEHGNYNRNHQQIS